MSPTNPARNAPAFAARIQFVMMQDGSVQCQCELAPGLTPLAAFHAVGTGMAQLAAEFQKQAAQQIQVVPASVLQLPN